MSGWQFGWRAAALTLIGASLGVFVAGWALTLFDSQYDGIASRVFVGVLAGAMGAALASPVSLILAAVVGAIISLVQMQRRGRVSA